MDHCVQNLHFAACREGCEAVVQAVAMGGCGSTCEGSLGCGRPRERPACAPGPRFRLFLPPSRAVGWPCRAPLPANAALTLRLRKHLLPSWLEGDEPGEHSGPTPSPRAAPTRAGLPAPPRKAQPKRAQLPPRMADKQRNTKIS